MLIKLQNTTDIVNLTSWFPDLKITDTNSDHVITATRLLTRKRRHIMWTDGEDEEMLLTHATVEKRQSIHSGAGL